MCETVSKYSTQYKRYKSYGHLFAVTFFASALPRSMKSGIWRDLVNINVYSKYHVWLKTEISIF